MMTPESVQAARDHLTQPHIKKKRLPAWLAGAHLPALVWADSEPLTAEQVQKVLGLLMLEGPDVFEPEHWEVFAAISPDARVAWSEAVEDAWIAAGGKPAHKWAVYQLAPMGAIARLRERAVELIELATHGNHKRALWYLEAMSRVDDQELRSWIFDLSIHAPYESTLQTHALVWHDHLLAISPLERPQYMAALNLYIREQHIEADIALPDFIPDETAVTLLDQPFLVTFVDEGFELGLRHPQTRKIMPDFPEQSITYDPTAWRVAHDTFQALEAELTPFIASWQKLFEQAMISARPYTYAYLRERFLGNRLMSHLIASLVWMSSEGQTVRLLEGACFDADYEELDLREDTTLKLVHPLEITPEEVQKWGAQLAEDEVFPLFPQFTREFFNASEHPFDTLRCDIGYDKESAFMELLIAHGWRHGKVTYGNYSESYRLLPGRDARVWFSHGTMSFNNAGSYSPDKPGIYKVHIDDLAGRRLSPSEVDPVVYSEAYLLLEQVAVAMHLL